MPTSVLHSMSSAFATVWRCGVVLLWSCWGCVERCVCDSRSAWTCCASQERRGGRPTWSSGTPHYLSSCLWRFIYPPPAATNDRKVHWDPKAWQRRKTFIPKSFHADCELTDTTLWNTARTWTCCCRWASLTTARECMTFLSLRPVFTSLWGSQVWGWAPLIKCYRFQLYGC